MSSEPAILTTTVGSYPVPDWLPALPSEQARLDATRVVFDTQRQARIDLPTDGELYRFDVNHPDTNGMIEYFIRPMAGIRSQVGRSDHECFAAQEHDEVPPQGRGRGRSRRSAKARSTCWPIANWPPRVAGGPFKFTVTSPYMLARTLLDNHYGDFEALLMAIAGVLAQQVRRAALRLPAGRRGQHPGQSRRRAAGRRAPSTACSMPSTASAPCISASATTAARPFRRASGAR